VAAIAALPGIFSASHFPELTFREIAQEDENQKLEPPMSGLYPLKRGVAALSGRRSRPRYPFFFG
jgi:hypothetical protein